MVRRVGTPSPTWRSFVRNEAIGIAAIDMFVAVSASFRLLSIGCVAAGTARSANLRIHGVRIWITRQLLFVQLATRVSSSRQSRPCLFQFLLRDNFQQGQA
jgi:hypothetical protein